MKLQYNKQDDILVIRLSVEPYDHAEMKNNMVVHYTKSEQPVLIEVLDASRSITASSTHFRKNKNTPVATGI